MKQTRWNAKEHAHLAVYAIKWLLLTIPLALIVGSAVAAFLWSLDWVTHFRFNHPWMIFLLPLAGGAVGAIYYFLGKDVEAGNNLIMDRIHTPGGGVPAKMAPLVFIGTIITHWFGGSAGREGTAVQMGGSIAGSLNKLYRLSHDNRRVLLMAGVAAGFAAVFGTPLAGVVFAIEVLAIGRVSYEALVPCLMAGILADRVTIWWGIHHTQYVIAAAPAITGMMLGKVAAAGIAFGLASVIFAELTHGISRTAKRFIPMPVLRPIIGGLVVLALVFILGRRDYLGLGVVGDPHASHMVSIVSSFQTGGADAFSWWWKILFTAITIGSGFKGGEVTPLFFIGAALGNTLSHVMNVPTDFLAGLGFVAVFAGATNTPMACIIMGIELFAPVNGQLMSAGWVIYLAVACCSSYLLSGHGGIYSSQRIGVSKLGHLAGEKVES